MKKYTIVIMILLVSFRFSNPSYTQEVVDPTTLNNKVMAGYQGWFGAPGDGSGHGWIHWGGPTIDAENISFDNWPDMREYDDDELFETDFVYKDLTNAGLYSCFIKKTVERHVEWMRDYGIDGVFVQRFIVSALTRRAQRDTVLQNVRYGAEKYGRVFANMYDMSGSNPESFVQDVIDDWKHLVDTLKITESPNYLHHNGLPVLSLWGVHVGNSGDELSAASWEQLVQWLSIDAQEKYRVILKAGVNNGWREDNEEWQTVYNYFEFISPWAVGRYSTINGANNYANQYFEADLNETASRDMEYIPVVFPGFSRANHKPGSILNQIPRIGGRFFWRQFYNAINKGCNMVYVAMFDEVDEGTAIYKIAENEDQIPTTGQFVTLDMDGYDLPSDWYLSLTGEATKMLQGEIPLTDTIPIVARPDNSGFNSQEVPTIMSPGETITVSISLKNTGTTFWTNNNYVLFSSVSPTNDIWGLTQVDLNDNEIIYPNNDKSFSFNITTPVTQGVYEFQWRMKKDGEWFGASSDKRYINVTTSSDLLDDCDALSNWTSSQTLVLNTTDQKQGTGCIEFSGGVDHDIEYEKIFSTPYSSGLVPYDATLQFWYYISDAAFMGSNFKVGLGSNGETDVNEYTWTEREFTTGWNLVTLFVSDANVMGTPDLDALNWFRIHNTKTGYVTTRLDEIQLFDRFAGYTKYNLQVNSGSGSGQYVDDAIVEISADEAPAGMEFNAWAINSGNVLFEDQKAMHTSIRIMGGDAELTAEYKALGLYFDDCDDQDGWGSSGVIVLNTTDQMEGEGCLEFSGDQTDEFKKSFSTAYNSGATHETGSLEFWYYTSDASLMGTNNQVEIGSGGHNDQSEYNWNLSGLTTGWNFISLNFNEASMMDSPDLSALNWFRIYNFKSGSVVTRIDAIEIVDPNLGDRYALTVRNGEGDGNYFAGTEVNINADQAPQGNTFDQWIIEEGNPVIEDVNAVFTKLIMGEENTIVTATYIELTSYELIVNNGNGDGTYIPGSLPVITADPAPAGKEFDKWEVNTGTITLSNEFASLTYFTMPEEDVEVTATYKFPASIDFIEGDSHNFNVYPNPTKSELTIDLTIKKMSDVNIYILDLSGSKVGHSFHKKDLIPGIYKLKLPVTDLKEGAYFINIAYNSMVCTELLLIQP